MLEYCYSLLLSFDIGGLEYLNEHLLFCSPSPNLTDTEIQYILNKIGSALCYFYEHTINDGVTFTALNNNLRANNKVIRKACAQLKYLPDDHNKGRLYKSLFKTLIHNKNKFDEQTFLTLLSEVSFSLYKKFYFNNGFEINGHYFRIILKNAHTDI